LYQIDKWKQRLRPLFGNNSYKPQGSKIIRAHASDLSLALPLKKLKYVVTDFEAALFFEGVELSSPGQIFFSVSSTSNKVSKETQNHVVSMTALQKSKH